MEFSWPSVLAGFGSALATGMVGLLAFGRQLSSNKALNANDRQQINMLEWQQKQMDAQREEIDELKADNEKKDETIREQWGTITELKSRLTIIESSQEYLKKQNTALAGQVEALTKRLESSFRDGKQSWRTPE